MDFLYESGLAVGKGSNSDGFKSLETLPTTTSTAAAATEPSSSKVLFHSLLICVLRLSLRGAQL